VSLDSQDRDVENVWMDGAARIIRFVSGLAGVAALIVVRR
jgi:hypothetical protein